MPNFDSSFDAFFSRKLGKQNSQDYTVSGAGVPKSDPAAAMEQSDPAAAMDQIEQRIAAMELRAEAARNLTQDAHEREAQALELNARVEDELAALKRQAIEMRTDAKNKGDASPSPTQRPNSALSKIKLVVGEPKKWLPALIKKQQSNLPKRLKD